MLFNVQSTVRHESEEMKVFSNTILLFPSFVFQIFLTENSWKGSRNFALFSNGINLWPPKTGEKFADWTSLGYVEIQAENILMLLEVFKAAALWSSQLEAFH